jgi:hypothetical protein
MSETTSDTRRLGRLLYGVLAPVSAWALQGLIGLGLGNHLCGAGTGASRTLVLVASAVALAVSLSALKVATTSWRELSKEKSVLKTEPPGGPHFLAQAGIGVGVVFTLGIVWAALPAVAVMHLCERVR